jgi:hypothetical protein
MSSSSALTPFQREVTSRFGLVPNFFVSTPDAPEVVERLWGFAVSAYFDNQPHGRGQNGLAQHKQALWH